MSSSELNIGLILPDVMGTYGDSGNAVILAKRASWMGIRVKMCYINISDPVPDSLDIYVLGGAEDFAQQLAVKHFRQFPGIQRACAKNAVILTVCAGMQIFGQWWQSSDGIRHEGLGILDIVTVPMRTRAIGEVVIIPNTAALGEAKMPVITGFENHRGGTILGHNVTALGEVHYGVGNARFTGEESAYEMMNDHSLATEGIVSGSVYGTYLHGPVLARNPDFADLLLTQATGIDCVGWELPYQGQLRDERIAAAQSRDNDS